MKKQILLFCLLPFISTSQRYDRTYEGLNYLNYSISGNTEDYALSVEAPLNDRLRNDVRSMKVISIGKSEEELVRFYEFNSYGKVILVKTAYSEKTINYLNDTLVSESVLVRKKKTTTWKHDYKDSKLVRIERLENGQLKGRYSFEYNDIGEISQNSYDTGRDLKKNYLLKHTFDKDNVRTESVYTRNGKVARRWKYDCKPQGELTKMDKTEDLSSQCKYNEEFSDGSYIVYKRTIEKGKQFLHKSTFTKDSVFVSHEQFLNDTILVRKSVIDGQDLLYEFYEKGRFKHGFESKKDNEGRLLKRTLFNGPKRKESYSTEYTYNEKGMVSEMRSLRRGKEKSRKRISYTYL